MPVAIVLRLDEATAFMIDALVEALPDRRTDRSYQPHLKLAVYNDPVDLAGLDAALVNFTAMWRRVPITLAGIGAFGGEPATLWLAVIPTADLIAIHTALHAALPDHRCDHHYKVGAWLPHVRVATTKFLGDAVEVMACAWTRPVSGSLDFLDLVRIEPDMVISSRRLRS